MPGAPLITVAYDSPGPAAERDRKQGDLTSRLQALGSFAGFEWDEARDEITGSEYLFELLGAERAAGRRTWSWLLAHLRTEDRELLTTETLLEAKGEPIMVRVGAGGPTGRTLAFRAKGEGTAGSRRIMVFVQDVSDQWARQTFTQDLLREFDEVQRLAGFGYFRVEPGGAVVGSDAFHRLIGTETGLFTTLHTLPDHFHFEDRAWLRSALKAASREPRLSSFVARLPTGRVRFTCQVTRGRLLGIIQSAA